jgi:signal peptidase I
MSTSRGAQDVVRERARMLVHDIEVDVDHDLQLVRAKAASLTFTSIQGRSEPTSVSVRRTASRSSSAAGPQPKSIAILAAASLVVVLGLAALTAVGGDGYVVTVVSAGMRPTLQVGVEVFVDPGAYESSLPERGDIVAFKIPDNPDVIAIKRIIGLPGDTVEQSAGTVYVNGSAIDEPYVIEDTKTLGPWIVAPGHVFVMGDNRPNSNDSRYSMGEIPFEDIFGRVLLDRDVQGGSLPVPPAPVNPSG